MQRCCIDTNIVLDKREIKPMSAGAAFDLYVGQFTTGEVAQICGVSRPVIDMWGTRGFIEPTRRERPIAGRLASTLQFIVSAILFPAIQRRPWFPWSSLKDVHAIRPL